MMTQQDSPNWVEARAEDTAQVLVVDDDLFISEIIEAALEDAFEVSSVHTAEAALKRIHSGPDEEGPLPDLILLDIMLGESTGYELCHDFKTHPHTRHIPIIMISSLSHSVDKVKAFEAGAVDFVSKPIEPAVLKMRINTHIKISHLQQDLEAKVRQRTENLQKANEALRAMLEHRDTEIRAFEESIRYRIEKYISPYLSKLEKRLSNPDTLSYLKMVRANFAELVATERHTIAAAYAKLTPAEIRVADLIRQGLQTKAIARELNLSVKSVYFYRNQIRAKLGLLNSKQNLLSYLRSQSEA